MLSELTIEDKNCIQGILMSYVKEEERHHRSMKNISVIMSVIGIAVNCSLINDMIRDIFAGESFFKCLLWIALILFFSLIMIMGMGNLYIELKERPAEQLMYNVMNGHYYMKDVYVTKVDNGSGEDWSTEYYAIISDCNGNLYEGTYPFFFKENYEIGDAIYFEIPIGEKNKKGFVIPRRNESVETWNYGLKMYNKYVK